MQGLDRWITGNYGEDQFKGQRRCVECDEYFHYTDISEGYCPDCIQDMKDSVDLSKDIEEQI